VKNRIADRTLVLRPDLWIEAREMNILSGSTHYWQSEALAVLPHCSGMGVDVGCGPRKKYPYAIGIDLNRGGGKVPEIICDVEKEELPFRDEVLDYILCSHIVEHFGNPLDVLRKLMKKLKKGGNLLLIVPDANHTPKMGTPDADKSHKWDFTPESFKELIASKLADSATLSECDTLKNQWSFNAFFEKI